MHMIIDSTCLYLSLSADQMLIKFLMQFVVTRNLLVLSNLRACANSHILCKRQHFVHRYQTGLKSKIIFKMESQLAQLSEQLSNLQSQLSDHIDKSNDHF